MAERTITMTKSRVQSMGFEEMRDAFVAVLEHGLAVVEQQSKSPEAILQVELGVPRTLWLDAGLWTPEMALNRFTDGVTRTYWRAPNDDTVTLAIGGLLTVGTSGSQFPWQTVRDQLQAEQDGIRELVNISAQFMLHEEEQTVALGRPLVEDGDVRGLRWYGGAAFTSNPKRQSQTVWRDWPDVCFYVPEWELTEQRGEMLVRLRLLIGSSLTWQERREQLQTQFAQYFSRDFLGDGRHKSATATVRQETDYGYSEATESMRYQDAVAQTAADICAGKYHKFVLARRMVLQAKSSYQPGLVVRELTRHYPDSFTFAIARNGSCFLGASPERLVRVSQHVAKVDCLAGTTARGSSETEDEKLAAALMSSAKNRLEHQVVLEWISSQLADFSDDLLHHAEPQMKKLANVQHLHTPITASLAAGVTIFHLAERLHPTPAVAGTPRDTVVPLIGEREQMDRGWYAGCVGVVNGHGDGELSVAIRSALITPSTAVLYAGAGIMGDSHPLSEWEETNLKLRPMQEALSATDTALSEEGWS
ncbi:isochorismate synthase [Alicyclobacillus curvatus]|nr:isochorismate synthase [Alicyclobacillus curvatus]